MEVAAEGAARWKLEATLTDLEASVLQVADKDCRDRLTTILENLKAMSAG